MDSQNMAKIHLYCNFFFCNATYMHKHRQIRNTEKIEIAHQEQERCELRIAKEIFYNCMLNRN